MGVGVLAGPSFPGGGSDMRRITSLAAVALLALAAPASAQEFTTGALKVKVGGRLQVQAATTSCTDLPGDPASTCTEEAPAFDMFIRRARVEFEAEIADRLTFKIQPDFEEVDGVSLKDAWGRYTFGPGAQLQIGHFKRPFDGFQLTSSTQILTIERDLDIPGVPGLAAASYDEFTTRFDLSDRDIGAQLEGEIVPGRLEYWVGVFNGGSTSENGDSNGKPQFIGRARFELPVDAIPVSLAGSYARTDRPFTAADGSLDGRYFNAFELFGELGDFSGGPHVQAGIVLGKNPFLNEAGGSVDLPAGEDFASMRAWQAIGSWKIAVKSAGIEAIEPLFRVTRADPATDVSGDENWGFTPGVQIFFYKRNKLALNWDFVTYANDALDSQNSFKAQVQFHF